MKKKKLRLLLGAFCVLFLFCMWKPGCRIAGKVLENTLDQRFSFGLSSGVYDHDITLRLSTNEWLPKKTLQIRYTLDGSEPGINSESYTSPLQFPCDELSVVTIAASVYDENNEKLGGPYRETYVLTPDKESLKDMLIVSLTAQQEDLFSEEKGILYPMTSFVTTGDGERWTLLHAQNFAQKGAEWARQAHIEILEGSGRRVISQGCRLSVAGNHGSVTHYPFSLNCKADEAYDESGKNEFAYDFFNELSHGGESNKYYYDSISLKNGGNDYYWGTLREDVRGTMLRNVVGLRLAEECGLLTTKNRPALVFLNGQFYNFVYLSANPTKTSLSVKTGLDSDYMVRVKGGERDCLTYFKLKKLYHSFPDMQDSEIFTRRAEFERRVDVEYLFRYYAFECLVGNADWPHNNFAIWRYIGNQKENNAYSDGKFREWVYDLDCTYNLEDWLADPFEAIFENTTGENCLLPILLQDEEYRSLFVNTVFDLLNSETFSEAHILSVIDEENDRFASWFAKLYGEEAEQGREENIALLKEQIRLRRGEVLAYLQKYFDVKAPYELSVLPAFGTGTVHVNSMDFKNTFYKGIYDSAYPVQITYRAGSRDHLAYWLVNYEKIEGETLTITEDMVLDGAVLVEPVIEMGNKMENME